MNKGLAGVTCVLGEWLADSGSLWLGWLGDSILIHKPLTSSRRVQNVLMPLTGMREQAKMQKAFEVQGLELTHCQFCHILLPKVRNKAARFNSRRTRLYSVVRGTAEFYRKGHTGRCEELALLLQSITLGLKKRVIQWKSADWAVRLPHSMPTYGPENTGVWPYTSRMV